MRSFDFIGGVEQSTTPTSPDPSVSADLVPLGFLTTYLQPTVIQGTRGTPVSVTAAGGVSFSSTKPVNLSFIQHATTMTTITKNPQVAAGSFIGQIHIMIVPAAAAAGLTFTNSNGMDLDGGPCVMLPGSILATYWDGTNWSELIRRTA